MYFQNVKCLILEMLRNLYVLLCDKKKLALIIFNYDEKRGKGKCRHFPCVGEFTTLRQEMLLCCNRLPQGPSYQTSRVRRPETNSIQLIELAGWTLTTVYTSLKQLDNVDNEWHTGSLHTGVFAQFDSGSHSKGESQSISLGGQRWSWRSTLGGLLDNNKKGIKHCASNNTEAHCKYQ